MHNIRIINVVTNCDNCGKITGVHIKLRVNSGIQDNYASTIIFAAFNETNLFSNGGNKKLNFSQNPARPEIYDFEIKVHRTDTLTFADVGRFSDYFQEKIIEYCEKF